jgi:hypothetical protein
MNRRLHRPGRQLACDLAAPQALRLTAGIDSSRFDSQVPEFSQELGAFAVRAAALYTLPTCVSGVQLR